MGNLLSCCFRQDNEETDPLLQEQDGYGSQTLDYNDMEQRQKERVFAREQELTEIVNSTNDKLIDIGMISNSGIVTNSHDLDSISYWAHDPERSNTNSAKNKKLDILSTAGLSQKQKTQLRNFYKRYFDRIEQSFTIHYSKPLVVDIQS